MCIKRVLYHRHRLRIIHTAAGVFGKDLGGTNLVGFPVACFLQKNETEPMESSQEL